MRSFPAYLNTSRQYWAQTYFNTHQQYMHATCRALPRIPPKNPPVAQPKHEQIHGLITSKVEIWQLTVYPTPPKKLWTTTTQWHLITMQHVVHMPRNHVCIDRWRSNFLPINYINFVGGAVVVVTSSMIYMQKQMLYVSWGARMKFFKLRSNKTQQELNNNNNNNNKSEDREKKKKSVTCFIPLIQSWERNFYACNFHELIPKCLVIDSSKHKSTFGLR